ncbi:MAG: c-type cytochrome OmcS [Desulfobulbaceae bacterium]
MEEKRTRRIGSPIRPTCTGLAIFIVLLFGCAGFAGAVQGECSNCHTMHNSQDNSPMRYDSGATPIGQLLRADCFGCHAQGTANAIEFFGTSRVPQVYHTDFALDLAGGNFAYIDGTKGGGASDAKGHNISGLGSMGADATLSFPPGGIRQIGHYDGGNITSAQLTCAGDPANFGRFGCHGNRDWTAADPYKGIVGAHHDNWSGSVNPNAAEMPPGHSYRFLVGVKGYEDTDWHYTSSATDHNEYFGRTSPASISCSTQHCHGAGGVRPPNGTMSEFCGTCHGNFHTISVGLGDDSDGNSMGIGTGTSPFLRHPTDLSLPVGGEYAAYTTYKLSAPVARTAVPAGVSGTVTPGSDAVMCLSCHVAHGSDYPDMLRFDYTAMEVGNGGAATGTGCFACHTSKD